MPIRFSCANPACGREVRAPDGTEGRKAKCPHCGNVQVIPAIMGEGAGPFPADDFAAPTDKPQKPQRRRRLLTLRQKKTYAQESGNAGKYVKLGFLIAGVAGVIAGIGYMISQMGKSKTGDRPLADPTGIGRYMDGVFGAKHMAESVSSMNNFRFVRDALEQYHAANGEYPLELKDLLTYGLNPAALHAPDRDKQAYAYIRDQSKDMPPDNILVYEEKPIHLDKCNVLRLDGRIETLTFEQLQAALDKTKRAIEGK